MDKPTKDQLIPELENSFQQTMHWINLQTQEDFNKELLSGKWTIAGHLYHLIKSTKAVSKGLLLPKIALKTMFGKNNRPERTYQEMVEKYETTLANNDIKAPSSYEAAPGRSFEKSALLKRFERELNTFIQALDKWTEEEMGSYIMLHPAIGKCTIREFIYFTTLHTYHHLNILKQQYGAVITADRKRL